MLTNDADDPAILLEKNPALWKIKSIMLTCRMAKYETGGIDMVMFLQSLI